MLTYISMSKLTAEQMVSLWNKGFEGYYINLEMDLDKFLLRAANEGLSIEHSLVVCEDGEPIGFVMNGFRVIDGKKVAWNGGTGISTEHRSKGIGKLLMERNLQLYQEQGVDIALLEALIQNERAIKLYQNVGYRITDKLIGLQRADTLDAGQLNLDIPHPYTIKKGLPLAVKGLSFYKSLSAWQTQWASIKDGKSLFVFDGEETVGYALYKPIFGEDGKIVTLALYQCESIPGRPDGVEILKAALSELYSPLDYSCKRITLNLRDSNKELIDILKQLGFTSYVEQVHMLHKMENYS